MRNSLSKVKKGNNGSSKNNNSENNNAENTRYTNSTCGNGNHHLSEVVACLSTPCFTSIMIVATLLPLILVNYGCTRIVSMKPNFGPPGTVVTIKYEGLWGDPCAQSLRWDGKTISDPFSGTFVVPFDATPGLHKITLVDKLDASEAALIFPIFRLRYAWDKFTVTNAAPITKQQHPKEAKQ